jgi:hypothetical protein
MLCARLPHLFPGLLLFDLDRFASLLLHTRWLAGRRRCRFLVGHYFFPTPGMYMPRRLHCDWTLGGIITWCPPCLRMRPDTRGVALPFPFSEAAVPGPGPEEPEPPEPPAPPPPGGPPFALVTKIAIPDVAVVHTDFMHDSVEQTTCR